jgi:hypothetical protein
MQCYHCGREVRETRHRQKTYAVDYYQLHTGTTEWATFVSAKPDVPPLRYLKLTHPVTIITCAQCYGSPDIRQMLDDDFFERRSIVLEAIARDSAPVGGSKG